jgi:NitT/TauT family transport system permease protein
VWVIILSTWEAAYRLTAFDPVTNPDGWKDWVFPAPSHVLDSLLNLVSVRTSFGSTVGANWPWGSGAAPPGQRPWYSGPLVEAVLTSGTRLLAGFGFSLLLGMTLGLAMWRWEELDRFLGPLFLGMQTLPSVCWAPLAVLAIGLNEFGVLFVLVMGSFFAIAIALRDGLRSIPPLYQRAGMMMGARGWRLYRYVLLPASLPAMTSSLRQGFSFAWRSLMGAELVIVVQRHGLGFLLEAGRTNVDVAQVVAMLVVMVVIGMLADRWVFAKLQQRVNARFGLSAAR